MLCWHVCGVVPQDTHNLRKDTGVRGSDSDACCGQQQRLEQRGQQTNLVRLWSKGCGRVRCTHVHFYHRAVAMRGALMSTFITELWPCAVHSCPLLSQSCGHAQWHSHPLIPDGGAGCRLHCCQMKQAHCRSCCQRPDGGSGLLMKHLLLLLPAAETTGQEDGKGVG